MMEEADKSATMFDAFVDDYEAACARGVGLSGESRDYFAARRIRLTAFWCASRIVVDRIVDFGCGLGHSTPYLSAAFPNASITGVDTSVHTIAAARRRYGSERTNFTSDPASVRPQSAQLVYSNGTFHHIEPQDRLHHVRMIWQYLKPEGLFALWENNPWNPGTRLVMNRIPFDRDAKTLSFRESQRMLKRGGFAIVATSFHFYFPAALKALRPSEPLLRRLPLGAQYCVLARRSEAA
jgi:trans-aconitate methyltransferase